MQKLLVVGSINMDLVFQTASLPGSGETVLGGEFKQVSGGKGANQAVAAARGGIVAVRLLAATGSDDFASVVLNEFRSETQLSLELIHTMEGSATGVAAIMVDPHGENLICVAPGANAQLKPSLVQAVSDHVFEDSAVLLASAEIPIDSIAICIQRAAAARMVTIFNPAPVVPELANHLLLEAVDILTPNEHEAQLLSGIGVIDFPSAVQAARGLQQQGVKTVIITLGSQGVVVVPGHQQGDPWMVKAPQRAALDTTAAGDCFNGLLAAELASGQDLDRAVKFAVQGASLSVTRSGAQTSLPTRQEVLSLSQG